jgi:molybdopterin-guanine dinucleotide biosynthesis protein A
MIEIDAYILIGGRSSRFGRDKAMAEIGGQALAERTLATLREALPEGRVTFVARNESQFAIEAIRLGAPFIFDLIEGRGPLGGLHAALADACSSWIFVMACDYPFVTPAFIRLMSEMVSDEYGAVVPVQREGRMQPLCAFYNVAKSRRLFEEIIERPRVPPPMHEIAKELSPRTVNYSEYSSLPAAETMFVNINSTDDLTNALKIERKLSAEK